MYLLMQSWNSFLSVRCEDQRKEIPLNIPPTFLHLMKGSIISVFLKSIIHHGRKLKNKSDLFERSVHVYVSETIMSTGLEQDKTVLK